MVSIQPHPEQRDRPKCSACPLGPFDPDVPSRCGYGEQSSSIKGQSMNASWRSILRLKSLNGRKRRLLPLPREKLNSSSWVEAFFGGKWS